MPSYIRPAPLRTEMPDPILEKNARRTQIRTRTEAGPLFQRLEHWMRALGFPVKDIFAVHLALEEAFTNALRHGHRGDPSKVVQIRYFVTAAEVWLEVEDQGRGFDPAGVPDPLHEANLDRPSGRGLFLMRAYMDAVSFNPTGNRVTLSKRRTQR